MNLSNLKRWWADQCAQSATGLSLGTLVAAHKQAMEQNRELLAENRRLANAIRAIHDYELGIDVKKSHEERLAWSHTYAVTCAALGISKGRAEAAGAKRSDKIRVANMAEAGIAAVKTGRSPLLIDRDRAYAKQLVEGGKDMQDITLQTNRTNRTQRHMQSQQQHRQYQAKQEQNHA